MLPKPRYFKVTATSPQGATVFYPRVLRVSYVDKGVVVYGHFFDAVGFIPDGWALACIYLE
jgi:hypothetical protein